MSVDKHLRRRMYESHARERFYDGPWGTFLSGCVLYDPPRNDLMGFASRFDLPNPAGDSRDPTAPIAYVRDPDEAAAIERERWYAVIDRVAERLEPMGSEFRELVYEAMDEGNAEYRAQTQQNLPQPYISVGPETTKEDVKRALGLIHDRSGRDQATKSRDPLLAIQIAIWKDELQLSTQEIAARLGRQLRPDDYDKPRRSWMVDDHAAEGRILLRDGYQSLATERK